MLLLEAESNLSDTRFLVDELYEMRYIRYGKCAARNRKRGTHVLTRGDVPLSEQIRASGLSRSPFIVGGIARFVRNSSLSARV